MTTTPRAKASPPPSSPGPGMGDPAPPAAADPALRESDERFRSAVNHFPHAFVIYDGQRRLQFANARAVALSGYTEQALLGHTDEELFPPEVTETYLPLLRRAVETRTTQTGECTMTLSAGTHTIVATYVPLLDEHGEIRQILGITHDLTERQQMERAAREQAEAHLAALAAQQRHLTLLNDITSAALAAHDFQQMLQTLADRLGVLLSADGAYLTLWDASRQVAVPAAAYGPLREVYPTLQVQPGEPTATEAALRAGHAVAIEDVLRSPLVSQRTAAKFPSRSLLAVPLIAGGQMLGAALIAYDQPHRFSEEEITRGEQAGGVIALALARARLFDEVRARAVELDRANRLVAALSEVAARLQASLDPDQVMHTLGAQLGRLGIQCVVGLSDGNAQAGVVRYISLAPRAVALIEKMLGRQVKGFRGEAAVWPEFADVVELGQAKFIPDLAPTAAHIVKQAIAWPVVQRVLRAAGVTRATRALILPLKVEGRVLGALGLWGEDLQASDLSAFSVFAGQVAAALEHAQLFEQVLAARTRLAGLSHRLVEVQEAERRHIARELHDEIGQTLTGLKLTLEMASRPPESRIRARLEEALSLINALMDRVHDLSLDLRPMMLDDLGLLPALLWHFERYTAQTGVRVDFSHGGLERRFTAQVETAAYRIVQEALTNVARHASVPKAQVRVCADRDTLSLRIGDRGAGFDLNSTAAAAEASGLTGMRERASLLGGRLTIESVRGTGTLVIAELPVGTPLERRERQRPA